MSRRPYVKLVRKIAPKSAITAAQPGQSLPGSLGTVQSVNGDGTAMVVYNGTAIPCQCLGDFVPVVGQGVLVLVEGQRNWCIGPVATAAQAWLSVADTVGYASGWSDFGTGFSVGSYRMIGDMVQIRGEVAGGTSTIFTLPEDYWPKASQDGFPANGDNNFASIAIDAIGNVSLNAGTAGFLNIPTIQFSVS